MILNHTSTTFVVKCDHCGRNNRSVVDGFHSPDEAIKNARNHGWGFGLDEDFCPDCNNVPHWVKQQDAINAAVAGLAPIDETRPAVRRCSQCALWRIYWW